MDTPSSPGSVESEASAVHVAADYAYAAAASRFDLDPNTIHRTKVCHAISQCMIDHLVEGGVPATRDSRGYHSYVELTGTDKIADGAWQQFLSHSDPSVDLPKVLFGTRDEVIAQAKAHGVPESYLKHWQTRTEPRSTQILVPTPHPSHF